MGKLSEYSRNSLLDHFLKTTPFVRPTHIYASLYVGDPDDAGVEVTEGGYARVICDDWEANGLRAIQNSIKIIFGQATEGWGLVSHLGLHDALTEGNLLGSDDFPTVKNIILGQTPSIAIGAIDIVFSAGGVSNTLADELLAHEFLIGAGYTPPTDLYWAYSRENPGDDAATLDEPWTGGYARKILNTFNVAADGIATNDGAVTFDLASGDQLTQSYWAIFDHITQVGAGGLNMLVYGTLDDPILIEDGDQLQFNDEQIKIRINYTP